jgi:molybdopterin-guanine dinucleotide biosynthesis protein
MQPKTGRVFVINDAGHDTTAAASFGEIKVLTTNRINVFSTDRMVAELKVKLKDFDPQTDYILLSGAIILNLLVLRILIDRFGKKSINTLLYNFNLSKYVVRGV